MTLGALLAIILCAILAAWISMQATPHSKDVLSPEKQNYEPWWSFFHNERFYRSFLVNLSFGGVSISIGIVPVISDFYDLSNPFVWVLLNLSVSAFAVSVLKDSNDPVTAKRRNLVRGTIIFAFVMFGLAAWAACDRQRMLNVLAEKERRAIEVKQENTNSTSGNTNKGNSGNGTNAQVGN